MQPLVMASGRGVGLQHIRLKSSIVAPSSQNCRSSDVAASLAPRCVVLIDSVFKDTETEEDTDPSVHPQTVKLH